MTKNNPAEQWKVVKFDFEFTNEFRLEVSNLGQVRTFNKISDGNILRGSMINGYRIIRLKLYTPRDEKTQKRFDFLLKQSLKLSRKLKALKEDNESKKTINETSILLKSFKKNLSQKFQDDLKARTINYHSLVHRLVANYFLKKPTKQQTIVAHLDHNKLNNDASNLKWMTSDENYEHQKSSPHVIKEKLDRRHRRKTNSGILKLTQNKVMLLKKLLNEGKPVKDLVKRFKVTDTQIFRIKRGENWGDIPAAK
ncbi:MAG: NUMOD4 motif-containing HNH endonuclease [Bacteroidota bacterium]|nr:NUMOD4 motif-containing HNH endonuclease [Bacteroidota bacterium]